MSRGSGERNPANTLLLLWFACMGGIITGCLLYGLGDATSLDVFRWGGIILAAGSAVAICADICVGLWMAHKDIL